jgi:RNA recognition motif-containing protein
MSCRKVFVGSIPGHLTNEQIQDYFSRIVPGAVFTLHKKKPEDWRNCGFGFLKLPCQSDITKILEIDHFLLGRKLKCERYLNGQNLAQNNQSLEKRRLFIRGLKSHISDDDLQNYFSKVGSIESAYTVLDPASKAPRNFGYVTFTHEATAQTMLAKGSFTLKGNLLRVHPFEGGEADSKKTKNQKVKTPKKLNKSACETSIDGQGATASPQLGSTSISHQSFCEEEVCHDTRPTTKAFFSGQRFRLDHTPSNIQMRVETQTSTISVHLSSLRFRN